MWDAQQVAEIRRMKEEWEVPHYISARHALACDEEMLEWTDEAVPAVLFLSTYHPQQDPQAAFPIVENKTLEQRFLEQAQKWENETAHLSSPLQKMSHPSYQAIMGMSAVSEENKRDVIRYMLRDLKNNQRDWFLALSYLTQHNPVRSKDYGKPSKMVESWMKWGESQGLA